MKKDIKIYVAGATGMVGSAIIRNLLSKGYTNILGSYFGLKEGMYSDENLKFLTLVKLDLTNQAATKEFFESQKPEVVVDAAAHVGGIQANSVYRAQFIYDNLMIQNNLIHQAHQIGVKKLLFLGSSCIYPRMASQPIHEDSLLTGSLEPTNEPYAIAKIAGIKMCENYYKQYGDDYISIMPTNLYGEWDNFDLESSHVVPAMIRKFHQAKQNRASQVELWGTGTPMREFLYVDDMADAAVFVLENVSAKTLYNELKHTHINIGTGEDITIRQLAETIQSVTGFEGKIAWDSTKPDGTPRKLLDVSVLHKLGWIHKTQLEEGLKKAYSFFNTLKIS